MDITDKSSVLGPRAAMMARLQQIHDDAAAEGTDEGAMIVTLKVTSPAYLSFSQTIAMRLSGSKTENRRHLLLRSLRTHY